MHLPNSIIIIDHFVIEFELRHVDDYVFDDNVFITSASGSPVIFQGKGRRAWQGGGNEEDQRKHVPRALVGALIEAAATAWKVRVEEYRVDQ